MSDDIKLEEVNPEVSPTKETSSEAPDEWQSLDGKSKERFSRMAKDKSQAQTELANVQGQLEALKSQPKYVPTPPASQTAPQTEEEKVALSRIGEIGNFATKDDLKSFETRIRKEEQDKHDRSLLDNQHGNLETKYSKGKYPKYDRSEVETFMNEKGVYDPDIAYNSLYRDEIIKLEADKLSGKSQQPVAKTRSRISTSQPWTPESLAERLNQKDGKEFYIKNEEKILKLNKDWEMEAQT